MKPVYILLLFLMLLSCGEKDFDIINLNNNQITILGHGGMGIENIYPLNSFEGIQNCLALGADGAELDIQMTKDSVLVVFHDERLEHSTTISGQIFNKAWGEIRDGKYLYPPYAGYKIITLDQLFSRLANPEKHTFFLDCKEYSPNTTGSYTSKFVNALLKIIDQYNLANNIFIESKKSKTIAYLRGKRPELGIFAYADIITGLPLIEEFG